MPNPHARAARGAGGSDHPASEKSQCYRVPKHHWSETSEKSHKYQASIQCWAIIGTPGNRHYMTLRWRAIACQALQYCLWKYMCCISKYLWTKIYLWTKKYLCAKKYIC